MHLCWSFERVRWSTFGDRRRSPANCPAVAMTGSETILLSHQIYQQLPDSVLDHLENCIRTSIIVILQDYYAQKCLQERKRRQFAPPRNLQMTHEVMFWQSRPQRYILHVNTKTMTYFYQLKNMSENAAII